jgi:hypothetical protein
MNDMRQRHARGETENMDDAAHAPERMLWHTLRELFPCLFVLMVLLSFIHFMDNNPGAWFAGLRLSCTYCLLFPCTYAGILYLSYLLLVRQSASAPLLSLRLRRVRHPAVMLALNIQVSIGDLLTPLRQQTPGSSLRLWCRRHPLAALALLIHCVIGVLLTTLWLRTYVGLYLWCLLPLLVGVFRQRARQPELGKLLLYVLALAGTLLCVGTAMLLISSPINDLPDLMSNPLAWCSAAMAHDFFAFHLYQFVMHLLALHVIFLVSYFSLGGTRLLAHLTTRVADYPRVQRRVCDRIAVRIAKRQIVTSVLVLALICGSMILGLAMAAPSRWDYDATHPMTLWYVLVLPVLIILLFLLGKYLIAPTEKYLSALSLTLLAIVVNIALILGIAFSFSDGVATNYFRVVTPFYLVLLTTLGILVYLLIKHRSQCLPILPLPRMRCIRGMVFIGLIASIAYHAIQALIFRCGYPQNTFLFRPGARFSDFFKIVYDCATLNPFDREGGYLPFTYFLGFVFSRIQPIEAGFVLLMGTLIVLLVYFGVKHLMSAGLDRISALCMVLPITLCAYPLLFELDRANFDSFMCITLILYYLALERGAERQAIVYLALGIAAKAYTVVYAVQLLQAKRFRALALLAGLSAGITVLCLAVFQGGLVTNIRQFFLASHGSLNNINVAYMMFSTTLFAFLSVAAEPWYHHPYTNAAFFNYYNVFCLLLSLVLVIYLTKYEHTRWRMVTLLTIAMLLLPFAGADYRSMFLLIPLWMYLAHATPSRHDVWYLLLFGLLLVPKDYGTLEFERSIAMLINPVLLMFLAGVLIKHNLLERAATRTRITHGE